MNYDVIQIPMARTFSDADFNCRGQIAPIDVADLAKSIQTKGLQFPISVQPIEDVKEPKPDGYDFRIIAGHRRFKACQVLGMETIPAFIRNGLSDTDARILNLSENFDRKDLNILQEARALQKLYEAGIPRDAVARELGKSSSWVQVRYNLLELPHEIQQEAAAGMINQFQIKKLYTLDNHEQMFEAVKKIKSAKDRGEKADIGKRQKQSANVRKARQRPEMFDMMELLAKEIGYGLHTRVLAWCSGEISTAEIFNDIKEQNPNFFPPTEF